ncbi:hypothetical protein HYH03_013191 [Edaphochlamys debaryana]|uniref:EGF-like domain-containing protein n=1 Tax=Edaphochlamys debaryana TaxID=47281 RepID=A0A835XRD0_9CHLO|nr:hypothetical protein HYH03_013191 [Edaphochlamys debaryana]|eukprot:KAG2488197.1 hypothetical protein HYH03_013191 [Edaphochlamys debaryana]
MNSSFRILAAVLVALSCRAEAWSPFREETKTCHPECSRHGNCNGETGQCDCPFGLTGPTCTERLLPACHPSTNDSTTPFYGAAYPKNCACYRQLRALPGACPDVKFEDPGGRDFLPCLYEAFDNPILLCYQYTDRPEAEQLSDSPPLDHPGLELRKIKTWPSMAEEVLPRDQWPKEVHTNDNGVWRPLRDCPDNYYEGKSCEIADPYHCFRNCSGVGQCVRGWCHCQPGYWGHGCTRRKAYTSSAGWLPNHADMKIYVYDLPENVATRRENNDWWSLIDAIYLAEIEFMEQLLSDWSVRTENPWEASLFVVPTFALWYTRNTGGPYLIFNWVSRYLQQTSPFWNATGGRNHVFFATNDQGACRLQQAPDEVQHSIKVVHYGLSPRRPYAHHSNPQAGQHMMGALPLPGHRFEGFPEFTAVNSPLHTHPMVDQERAKFCLAPSGFGWGVRLTQVMMTGCVPVIIQDHMYQAFWDVIPYEEFSIRISRADLHRIVEILDVVTPEQLIKLQEGVAKWRSAFHWIEDLGGMAYNYTVKALKRRALHLWSEDFRHLRHAHRLRS